jgi:hypothetical protein
MAEPFLIAVGQLIDAASAPFERLQALVRLARLQEKARRITFFLPSSLPNEKGQLPLIHEVLQRAFRTLPMIENASEREECLETLAFAFGETGLPDMAQALLDQNRGESESATLLLGLSAGILEATGQNEN